MAVLGTAGTGSATSLRTRAGSGEPAGTDALLPVMNMPQPLSRREPAATPAVASLPCSSLVPIRLIRSPAISMNSGRSTSRPGFPTMPLPETASTSPIAGVPRGITATDPTVMSADTRNAKRCPCLTDRESIGSTVLSSTRVLAGTTIPDAGDGAAGRSARSSASARIVTALSSAAGRMQHRLWYSHSGFRPPSDSHCCPS